MVSFGRVTEVLREDRELLESHPPPLDPVDSMVGHEQSDRHSTPACVRGQVAFEGVSFAYDTQSPVLREVSFCVEPGQVVALLGSPGSGKTTLVTLLPRFYEYTEGSLTLDGVELTGYSRQFLRQQIGIVEQEPFLFSRTIRENITYGVGHAVGDTEVEAAARAAAIHESILSFPQGYNTLVGERGVTLSGGQKQRVAIARTLLRDPCILIMDDSTSSVDTETEAEIRDALDHLMRGRTTFIVAHRIQSVMNADLILVLDQGRIVERGSHEQLLAANGLYRRIHDMQARVEVELEKELTTLSVT
jgi:ATP-binding cassette subfamily B protein